MPKAKGKGGKNRRRGKNDTEGDKRELIFKEDGQEYAQVVKMLGNGRLEAKCQDGENRLCQIRGQMRKKVWIVNGDIILLSLREFQDERADVIHKYTADEARNLKTYGELKSDFAINETAQAGEEGSEDEEGGVEFEEADIDDICEYTGRVGARAGADWQNVLLLLVSMTFSGCIFSCPFHKGHTPLTHCAYKVIHSSTEMASTLSNRQCCRLPRCA